MEGDDHGGEMIEKDGWAAARCCGGDNQLLSIGKRVFCAKLQNNHSPDAGMCLVAREGIGGRGGGDDADKKSMSNQMRLKDVQNAYNPDRGGRWMRVLPYTTILSGCNIPERKSPESR